MKKPDRRLETVMSTFRRNTDQRTQSDVNLNNNTSEDHVWLECLKFVQSNLTLLHVHNNILTQERKVSAEKIKCINLYFLKANICTCTCICMIMAKSPYNYSLCYF